MRKTILALLFAFGMCWPAQAQIAIGETGLTLTTTLSYGSDYVSRGFSQTRGRMTAQAQTELVHDSGVYIGASIANVRFAYSDARQEVDLWAGYRFELWDFNVDVGLVSYFYPGYSVGRSTSSLDYFEGYLKVTRQVGPVQLQGQVSVTPDYFGGTGLGIYLEAGADWATGLWDLTLGGRFGYQMIDGNQNFGTPDYAWWGVQLSRDFEIEGFGTLTASVGYMGTSVARRDCFSPINSPLNVCSQRALAQIAFKF